MCIYFYLEREKNGGRLLTPKPRLLGSHRKAMSACNQLQSISHGKKNIFRFAAHQIKMWELSYTYYL